MPLYIAKQDFEHEGEAKKENDRLELPDTEETYQMVRDGLVEFVVNERFEKGDQIADRNRV